MRFARRMNHFGEGIFSKLLELKRQKEEKGEPVIDLSVGAPNIPPAGHITEALCEAAADPNNYIYAIHDQKELLEAVSLWYQRRYGVTLNPSSEICSLLGSQEGLAHIALSIIDEGDIVLVPDPCYPVFADGPLLAGASLFYMPQRREKDYLIDFSDIPEEIAIKARFMIVSYPNNPTTVMAPDSFYKNLIEFAKKYDIVVLHDNAYSELVFDQRQCGSFLSFPGAKEIGVEFNSLSKTYGLAGARIGFCLGNREIVEKIKTLKSNMDYGMFLPVQKAAIAAITGDQSCVESTRKAYERRRDALCEHMTRIGWNMEKPQATMFVWAKIPDKFKDSETFSRELLEKAGLLVTPGSAFGPSGEGFVRLALVREEEVLIQAAEQVDKSGILR
ncbi:MAG: aminotransferase class I/II-fold pyridoxal phosphate-dependent enzyme [Paenibacillaceae bacterium]|nr:aminotransferase class I/II-fold pyridoxal phosphate-dependent enzyme [Paenibacillaceae bacterium]